MAAGMALIVGGIAMLNRAEAKNTTELFESTG
jgi:hypothetical protein